VHLSNGDGTFQTGVSYAAIEEPRDITSGDFNNDGHTDIATALSDGFSVGIYLGASDGTLVLDRQVYGHNSPQDLIAADLDGDGDLDIAATETTRDVVSVTFNNTVALGDFDIDSIDFGSAELGSGPMTQQVVVTNSGSADLITTATLTNDGGGAFSITSPPVSPLAVGSSTTLEITYTPSVFGVVNGAVDILTNDPTNSPFDVTLLASGTDSVDPESEVTGPSGSLSQASASFDVTFTASDSGSGVSSVELFYQFDGGSFASFGTFSSSPISFDTSGTGGDGTYGFYTVATDGAGNTEADPGVADTTVTFDSFTAVGEWRVLD